MSYIHRVEDAGNGVAGAPRPHPKRVALLVVLGVVVLLVAACAWLAVRALNAKSALEDAQAIATTIAGQLAGGDSAGLPAASKRLSSLTATAVEQTSDPLWRVAELVPALGANFSAVRAIAESVDVVARDAVAPLSRVAGSLTPNAIAPVDGRVDLAALQSLAAAVAPAASAFEKADLIIGTADFQQTIPPVAEAGRALSAQFETVRPLVDDLNTALRLAPDMLGASGPRSYLLLFQNLAETTALGGTAAALTEVNIDNGAISIGRQASSQDFGRDLTAPALAVDPGVAAIFNPFMYATLNLATSRPDFPTAAEITSAFWQRDFGTTPDGVIAVDPIALSHILRATGPVTLSTGEQLSAENTVPLLLNEIYLRYPGPDGPDQTDAFFADAARAVFEALMHTGADSAGLLAAIGRGVGEHRVMAWSADPAEQAVLAQSPLAGTLPTENVPASVTGVFFRDMSASKVDYYLQTAATLESDACTSDSPTFTATADLHSTLTQELADSLPPFISGGVWRGEKFKTQVFVYGPPGTTLADAAIAGGGDEETFIDKPGTDLGRPVATFWVMLSPGESVSLSAVFSGQDGDHGQPELWTTPMLNPTETTVLAPGCPAR